MNIIEKSIILEEMEKRLAALQERHDRDFSSGVVSDIYSIRELKLWISKIKRGEFDCRVWE